MVSLLLWAWFVVFLILSSPLFVSMSYCWVEKLVVPTSTALFRRRQYSLPTRWNGKLTTRPFSLESPILSSSSSAFQTATSSDNSFFTHVLVEQSDVTVPTAIAQSMGDDLVAIGDNNNNNNENETEIPTRNQLLTPNQLLKLGSVWYMSAKEVEHNNNSNIDEKKKPHSLVYKPQRLSLANVTMVLQKGDYLRIHHTPRRFVNVYQHDWSVPGTICDGAGVDDANNVGNQTTSSDINNNINNNHKKKSVIVHEGDGFWIIDKPPLVPVHATVDNVLENVVHQLDVHNPSVGYVTTTQRIDINTSGLLVVATKREFAAYFAQLLRQKTKHIKKTKNNIKLQQQVNATIINNNNDDNTTTTTTATVPATNFVDESSSNRLSNDDDGSNIQKEYKCLVCVQDDGTATTTTVDAWQNLKKLEDTVVRHFLESSIRAPKRFETTIPSEDDVEMEEGDEEAKIEGGGRKQKYQPQKWLECLLRIRNVSPLIPVPTQDSPLAQALWSQSVVSIPPNTKAVCEVDIQLLTGRTHQIRGQLSKLGYPIVGDEQYGGAIPNSSNKDGGDDNNNRDDDNKNEQLLALQCCQIGFWDANYEQVWNRKRRKDIIQGFPSNDRWVSVSLNEAWWTPLLSLPPTSTEEKIATTSTIDLNLLQRQKKEQNGEKKGRNETARIDLLPPRVQLSPGKNKYVLVKAVVAATEGGNDDDVYWFVKSASPEECGGPYHANVAQDLIEWIEAAGFSNIQVTGGGRIDFNAEKQHAHVYGFSYGYGKGNHGQVAALITASTQDGNNNKIRATYDNSDSLY